MSGAEDNLTVLILFLFCFFISYWEYSKEGTIITPFGVLAWPYTIVVAMVNLVGKHFGFFTINLKSIVFILICLIFFLIGGRGINLIFTNIGTEKKFFINQKDKLIEIFNLYRPLFIALALISIIASIINLYQTINEIGGWFFIASKEFEEDYGKGVLAHVMALNRPAFIFLCADYFFNKRKSILILLILMFLSVLILQIRNNIITILLSGIFFSYFCNLIKLNLKKVFVYSIIIYVIFDVSFIIGYSRIGMVHAYSSKIQFYLLNHFFAYLFGGPIGFSEILKDSTYPLYSYKEVFAVPINLYNVFIGGYGLVDIIFHHWIPISNIYNYLHISNVCGIFGMLYMYIGSYATFIYIFFLGSVVYFFRFLAYEKNSFIGFQLVYAYILSYLTISFFGLYFNILIVYEGSFFMLVIPFFYLLFRRLIKFVTLQLRINYINKTNI